MRDCDDDKLVRRFAGFVPLTHVFDLVFSLKKIYPELKVEYGDGVTNSRKVRLSILVPRCEAEMQRNIIRGAIQMYLHLRMEHV